jgi:hypothetical protein
MDFNELGRIFAKRTGNIKNLRKSFPLSNLLFFFFPKFGLMRRAPLMASLGECARTAALTLRGRRLETYTIKMWREKVGTATQIIDWRK